MAPRKKGKRRDDDDDWENEALGDADQAKNAEAVPETSEETKPKKGKSKGKKGKHVDSEDESESKDIVKEEDIKPVKKGKNKKSAKKDDNWEEEEDVKEKVEEQEEEVVKPSKKGKKGKKVVDWEEEEEDMKEKVEEEEEEVVKPAKKGKKAKKAVDWELLEVEQAEKEEEVEVEEKPVKKEKGKKQKKVDDWEEEEEREKEEKEREVVEEKDEEVVTGGIKTAAQKKAEKKQKEKEKKKAQAANKKKDKKEEDLDSLLAELAPAPAVPEVPVAEPVAAEIEEDEGEGEEKGEGAKKNKKKKKKTAAKEKEEPEAAKPAKVNARVKAMQEALQLKLELEEAMRKEEEAARLAEDERIRKIEEEARLEKERKEQKKIREAEKKARLKAEGKLLTKAQREAQAKREAYLASLKAQGLELPKADEGEKKKKVVYSKKKKATKTTEEAKPEVEIEEQIETETSKESGDKPTTDKPVEEDAPASWEDEGVVESWEEAETEQIKEVEKVEEPPKVGASTTTPVKKPTKKPTQSESESSDSESDSDSDSDSDSESESETDNKKEKENNIAIAKKRIAERLREAEANKSKDNLRSPICCVLGHVDTGKTKILDHIRRSNVQNGEAGGITQQIGATYVPAEALTDRTKELNDKGKMQINVPGLLIIDTPGHESFSNLRSRGSSLCDISVLVIDVMHGLEPQTIESIQLLRKGKTPFVVALNKVDRFYGWQANPNSPIRATLKKQKEHVLQEFKERSQLVITQLAEQGLNAALYYENSDVRKYVSLVPCSAVTGEGLPDLLMLLVQLTQKLMSDRIAFINKVECSVLEVKMIQGLGTTVDVILSQGVLRTGDTIVVSGLDGPIVTSIRALLMPQPMKELRVKSAYQNYEEIYAAQGVKISAKGLEEAVAGTQLYVAHGPEEVEYYKTLVRKDLENALQSLKTDERGVTAQASTLGALEALLVFLRDSKIPVGNVNIGPVNRRDVVKCSTQMNHNEEYGVILAFDVKVSKDAADMAKDMGVIIFTADIIYHLFDRFTEHMAQLHEKKKEEHRHKAWFPCYMTVKPEFVFNTRDPIIMGVDIVEGRLTCGVPIVVPSKEFLEIGIIESIEINNKQMTEAKVGQSVCVKIRNTHDAPRMFGRHFDETDMLCTN
eukprot:Ihof_evm1s344 gene=Ihof_evmTU1s344